MHHIIGRLFHLSVTLFEHPDHAFLRAISKTNINQIKRTSSLSLFWKYFSLREHFTNMGKAKQTRKYAVTKKIMSHKDTRVRENAEKAKQKAEAEKKKEAPKHVEQANSSLFFQYNTQLGPPYHVLVDTNFINFSIRCVGSRVAGCS